MQVGKCNGSFQHCEVRGYAAYKVPTDIGLELLEQNFCFRVSNDMECKPLRANKYKSWVMKEEKRMRFSLQNGRKKIYFPMPSGRIPAEFGMLEPHGSGFRVTIIELRGVDCDVQKNNWHLLGPVVSRHILPSEALADAFLAGC